MTLESSPARAASAAATSGRTRRVLVVDDDRDLATIIRYVLLHQGYAVHAVFDGRDAVEAALRFRPDAVLCDIGLRGVDGYDVASALSASACGATLIALTGHAAHADVSRALAAGFHHHLAKPVDFAALAQLLGEPVERRNELAPSRRQE
jgi:CheY-like chemotaxis protein